MTASDASAAEISSLSSSLDSAEQRVAAMTVGLGADEHADLLAALVEAERSLRSARRHLDRAHGLARRR